MRSGQAEHRGATAADIYEYGVGKNTTVQGILEEADLSASERASIDSNQVPVTQRPDLTRIEQSTPKSKPPLSAGTDHRDNHGERARRQSRTVRGSAASGGSAEGVSSSPARSDRARVVRLAHRQPCRASTNSSGTSAGELATSTPIRSALQLWSRRKQLPCRTGHVQHRTSTPTTSLLPSPSMNSISNDLQREVAISKSL